ncbi:BspA family leucine-rich repeat surface protein, partial [bacterium]|nr:BspA family leucine-rich repeat surface protein [bacterium]
MFLNGKKRRFALALSALAALAPVTACTGGQVQPKVVRGDALSSIEDPTDRTAVEQLQSADGTYANKQTAAAFPVAGDCITGSTSVRVTIVATGAKTTIPCDPDTRKFSGATDLSSQSDGAIPLKIEYLSDKLAPVFQTSLTVNKLTSDLPAFSVPALSESAGTASFPAVDGAASYQVTITPASGNGTPVISTTVATNSVDISSLQTVVAYNVSISAIDAAGNVFPATNSGSATWTRSAPDTTAPTLTFNSVSGGNPASTLRPVILGTASEPSTVTLYFDSSCASAKSAATANTAFASPGITVNSDVASNSTTTIYAKAVDTAGNASTCTNLVTYTHTAGPITAGSFSASTNLTDTTFTLNWSAATDNLTTGSPLEYLVCSGASIAAIDTVAECEAATPEMTYTAATTTLALTSKTASTTYYYNVVVKNSLGDKVAYAGRTQTTYAPPFISTWKTDNSGTSSSTQITLPLESTGTYDFLVDWGDSTTSAITNANWSSARTKTYASAGTYTVRIYGTVQGWRFNSTGDRQKITGISSWGPLRLGNSGGYFRGASNLVITATDSLNLTGTTNMSYAFAACSSLTTVPGMNNWNTAAVTNMSSMFEGATAFNQDIGNWNTAAVTNMSGMFGGASAFNQNIGNWNTAAVTNMSYMFYNTSAFNQNIGNWNTAAVTNMSGMFDSATAFNQNIGNWNTASVTNMSGMFWGATNFNQNIGNWNTAAVTNMGNMFYSAAAFNQNIGNWNTSAVTNMSYMFYSASAFNQNIGNWNTAAVTNMSGMFFFATAFNQNIGNWNTAAVTSMGSMFRSTTNFNQNIGNWNTAAVTDIGSMFQSATAFNQDISNWNTAAVTTTNSMFSFATNFNQNIGNWNTAAVTDMSYMFWGATNFNQNIGNWNVAAVTQMVNMFISSGLTQSNYDRILIGWSAQNVKTSVTFHGGSAKYSAVAERAVLTGTKSWTITDGGAVTVPDPAGLAATTASTQVTLNWTSGGGTTNDYLIAWQAGTTAPATCWDGTTTTSATTSATITGLTNDTPYSFRVCARSAGAAQTSRGITVTATIDTTPPSVTSTAITIPLVSVTATGMTLQWTKASDTVTAPSALQYEVRRSTADNISTVTDAEANGTVIQAYTADIDTFAATGLDPSTTYYFNVIVRDAAGNKRAYTTASQSTGSSTTAAFRSLALAAIVSDGYLNASERATSTTLTGALDADYDTVDYAIADSSTACSAATGYSSSPPAANATGFGAEGDYKICARLGPGSVYGASPTFKLDVTAPTFMGVQAVLPRSTGTSAFLFWNAPTDNFTKSSDIAFDICVATQSSGSCQSSFSVTQSVNGGTFDTEITSLTAGVNYQVLIRARDQAGNRDTNTRTMTTAGLTGVTQIATGYQHTCALLTDQTVKCWGYNSSGQIGDGTTTNRSTPTTVTGLANVSSIAAGESHTCAVLTDQTVKCWGGNAYGQLGDGTQTDRRTPTTVTGLTSVSSIATGYQHTCALLTDQTVKCWGYNSSGQIGDGTISNRSTPTTVTGLTSVSAIATEYYHTCAVLTDQTVKCWGDNSSGQLGDGTTSNRPPTTVTGLTSVSSIATGGSHTCAVLTDQTVKCWG